MLINNHRTGLRVTNENKIGIIIAHVNSAEMGWHDALKIISNKRAMKDLGFKPVSLFFHAKPIANIPMQNPTRRLMEPIQNHQLYVTSAGQKIKGSKGALIDLSRYLVAATSSKI